MNPLVAKVGAGSVAAVGAITGGVFLHKHFEFPKGLDKELINETEASLSIGDSDNFSIGSTNNSEVTLKVKTTSTKTDSKFLANSEKWICTIKGIAKDSSGSNVTLTESGSSNFDKSAQKTKFKSKFDDSSDNKQQYKEGFVKSCARNRTPTPTESENWTSEIVVNLKLAGESSSQKYEFSNEDVKKIFEGTWINPK